MPFNKISILILFTEGCQWFWWILIIIFLHSQRHFGSQLVTQHQGHLAGACVHMHLTTHLSLLMTKITKCSLDYIEWCWSRMKRPSYDYELIHQEANMKTETMYFPTNICWQESLFLQAFSTCSKAMWKLISPTGDLWAMCNLKACATVTIGHRTKTPFSSFLLCTIRWHWGYFRPQVHVR